MPDCGRTVKEEQKENDVEAQKEEFLFHRFIASELIR